jgi:tetratricopeptide (TPR) repeat protein
MECLNLDKLSLLEIKYLRYFSILPSVEYTSQELIDYFRIGAEVDLGKSVPVFVKTAVNYFLSGLHLPDLFNLQKTAEKAFMKVLDNLAEKSLLKKQINKKPENHFTYMMGQDIIQLVQKELIPSCKNCLPVIEGFKQKIKKTNLANPLKVKQYLPYAENIVKYIHGDDDNLRIINFILASRFREIGNYDKSIKYAINEIKICEHRTSDDKSTLANSYYNLSVTYQIINEKRKSLEYLLKALTIRELILDKNHPWLATSYSNVASSFREIGEHHQSIKYLLKELAIRESNFSEYDIDLAHAYKNLAISHFYLKNYQKANEFIEKATSLFMKSLPNDHLFIQSTEQIKKNINETYKTWEPFFMEHSN